MHMYVYGTHYPRHVYHGLNGDERLRLRPVGVWKYDHNHFYDFTVITSNQDYYIFSRESP